MIANKVGGQAASILDAIQAAFFWIPIAAIWLREKKLTMGCILIMGSTLLIAVRGKQGCPEMYCFTGVTMKAVVEFVMGKDE